MSRLLVLRIILFCVLFAMVGRLYHLQLVDSDARQYGSDNIQVTTTRYLLVSPRRGDILASDGQTRLAESVSIFSAAILPGSLPPPGSQQRQDVLARMAQICDITSTLRLSSTRMLQQMPALQQELAALDIAAPPEATSTTWDVAPQHTLDMIRITERYSDVLSLHNPIETMIDSSTTRGYETVIIKEDISRRLELVIRENSTHLPGVVVVEDFQRRYPQSAQLPSLSHILGYSGRINACELVIENPASSWLHSMTDVVSHAPDCGINLRKEIRETLVGMPLYKNDDRIGKDGLEASYEAMLRGTIGIQMIGVDALERPVSEPRTVQPVQPGHSLVTTLDTGFQRKVETILRTWLAESERRRSEADDHRQEYKPITNGAAVVLNVRDGRVLALVSLPTYDNNVWVDRTRADELQNLLSPADPEKLEELIYLAPLTNRTIAGRYPPGSSLKQFVGAAALQQGVIQPDTTLRDPGRIVLEERSGHTFVLPNSVPRDNGEITVSDALKVSSNVFFASVAGGNDQATNLGADATIINGLNIGGLSEGLKWFGFGSPTGIKLPSEASGRVPTPNWKAHSLREPWTTGDTYNTSIGQGYLEVTPLQLTVGTAAVANQGMLYRPQLVQQVLDSQGQVVDTFQPEAVSQVPVDDGYLAVMREGMRRSITEGLNVAARNECSGLSIAGKTGTAEFGPIIITEQDRQMRQSHSWFAGFAPYENPEIAVVVLLEGTGDLDDGSTTLAVPAVTQIMQAYFNVAPPAEQPPVCPEMPPLPPQEVP
jgi:penicillin-binding protein 2